MDQFAGKYRRAASWIIYALALLAATYSAYIAIRFNGQHLLVRAFNFRETQTALTSYWMCREGFSFAYATPVGGYPWSIPFEFPLYQWIVSLISCHLGLDLERVGRLVSYAFLLACALPAARISRSLFADKWLAYFAAFIAIFFTAPLHLFFGQSFLMESAALFFTLGFTSYMISVIQGDRSMRTVLIAGVFLTLAILQKSTTVLPLVPLFGFWLLAVGWRDIRSETIRSRTLWAGVLAVIIPFIIGAAWAKYTDIVKLHNTFGAQLTSSGLMQWNFGGDRLDWRLWQWIIWIRNVERNVAGWVGVGVLAAGLVLLDGKHRKLIVGLPILFLAYFMIFTNLQFVHEYYQMSNEWLLIGALAVALGGAIVHRNMLVSAAGVVALIAIAVINVHTFRHGDNYREMHGENGPTHPVLESSYFIRDHTDPAKPIVVYGDDWNSEFPFFAERRAFVVMKYFSDYKGVVADPAKYLNGEQPSAVMICRDERTPEFEAQVKAGFKYTSIKQLALCDVLLK
jgi:hypothetical protein